MENGSESSSEVDNSNEIYENTSDEAYDDLRIDEHLSAVEAQDASPSKITIPQDQLWRMDISDFDHLPPSQDFNAYIMALRKICLEQGWDFFIHSVTKPENSETITRATLRCQYYDTNQSKKTKKKSKETSTRARGSTKTHCGGRLNINLFQHFDKFTQKEVAYYIFGENLDFPYI
jgi:hypothetical protein